MIIYLSITIWMILVNAAFAGKTAEPSEINSFYPQRRVRKAQVLLTVLPLVFIIGMRSKGSDTAAYIIGFRSLRSGLTALFSPSTYRHESEILFKFLGVACKTVSKSYHFYLFVIALLTGLLIADSLRDYTEYYSMAILLFMLQGQYGWMINGIRQFLAVAVVFYGARYIAEKKLFRYLVFCLIAVLIHKSSIIMVPMYYIAGGRAWNKKTLLFIALGVIAISFLTPFISAVDYVTAGTGYEGYAQQLEEGSGSNIIRTFVYAVPPVMALIKRREIAETEAPFINVCINMSIVCAVMSLIANFTNGILMGRIPAFFSIYSLVLIPWLLNETSYRRNRFLIAALMYVFYALYSYVDGIPYYYSNALFGGKLFPGAKL